jgi:hypothetical protein
VSSDQQITAIEAELTHYRNSAALLRARLYRHGVITNTRLEEIERRHDSAQRRLRAVRAEPPPAAQP